MKITYITLLVCGMMNGMVYTIAGNAVTTAYKESNDLRDALQTVYFDMSLEQLSEVPLYDV